MAKDVDPSARIYVAGHAGMVGSALLRRLKREGFERVLTAPRRDLDLREQEPVRRWFREQRPDLVFLVAGTVGGIQANATRPAEFLFDNLMIHANVIHAAYEQGVSRLLYLGSSCIYPKYAPQPIEEGALLTGPLEPTNEAYAVAKISGLKMCEHYRRQYGCDFITAMPTNLYGACDNFDLDDAHVLPALIRRFHDAKIEGAERVRVWGTGEARREFLHVDDLADACLFLARHYEEPETINVGTGEDIRIRELAEMIREIVAPEVRIEFDPDKPDGTPRKLLDVERLHTLGWHHRIGLRDGIRATYEWFCAQTTIRGVPKRA